MINKVYEKLEKIDERLSKIELQMAMFRGARAFLSILGLLFGIVVGLVEIIKK